MTESHTSLRGFNKKKKTKNREMGITVISTLMDHCDESNNIGEIMHMIKGHYMALLFLLFLTPMPFDLIWNVTQVNSNTCKSLFCLAYIWYFILIQGFTNINYKTPRELRNTNSISFSINSAPLHLANTCVSGLLIEQGTPLALLSIPQIV